MSTDSSRYRILACYPNSSSSTSNELNLLRTNSPLNQLNEHERQQRIVEGFHQPIRRSPVNDHERLIFELSHHWNIHSTVLKFNYRKVEHLLHRLATTRMYHFSTSSNDEYIREEEYKLALEFFLQFDTHVFYMKTCSYRGAQPIFDLPRSIFSISIEPKAQYSMTRCHQSTCCLCYPRYQQQQRQQPIIEFDSQQYHTFVNGYRSILNCPASCTTKNIIYVLTCPCKKYDYIGETSRSLADRLTYHQEHGNRIVQERLLGKTLTDTWLHKDAKSFEMLVNDSMKLYQHSAHCPSAIQWFLDENPQYWPFIPQRISDIEEQRQEREIDFCSSLSNDARQYSYADDLPNPPNKNFHFTDQQKQQIDAFFLEKKYLRAPNAHLDLYQAKIIAVLPTQTTDALRRFIEALFITHAETKLNTIGHLDGCMASKKFDSTTSCQNENEVWCENLIQRTFVSMMDDA